MSFQMSDEESEHEYHLEQQFDAEFQQGKDNDNNDYDQKNSQIMETLKETKQTKLCTKNIAKTIGNYYRKRCNKKKAQNQQYKFSQGTLTFITKFQDGDGEQIPYRFYDIQQLIQSGDCSDFQDFAEYDILLHLIHSQKIENPMIYVPVIEQLNAGCNDPKNFESMKNGIE